MRFGENQLIPDVLPDDDTDRPSGCPAWSGRSLSPHVKSRRFDAEMVVLMAVETHECLRIAQPRGPGLAGNRFFYSKTALIRNW